MSGEVTASSPGLRRARAYLAERFPLLPSALLSALYVGGGFAVVGHGPSGRLAVAALVVLFLLLSLRLADESKDFEKDSVVHPDRLVQRGAISLREIRRAELAVIAMQAGLAAALGLPAFFAWLAVLAYAGLMRVEFFAGDWLEPRPVTYALTHQPIMLLLTAFIHVAAGAPASRLTAEPLVWHQVMSLASMFGFEVSRKLKAPSDEHPANPTYSQSHGPLVAGLFAAGLLAVAALAVCRLLGPGYLPALALAIPALVYAARPTRRAGKLADLSAQVALLALHGALAARLWSAAP